MTLAQRLRARVRSRWPAIRRQLPRDLAIVLLIALVLRHVSLAWIMTDSVHSSAALVLRDSQPHPGDLAVFAYSGQSLEHYYSESILTRVQRALGQHVSLAGPRKGDGFIKYLVGVPGDRIEVLDRHVWLVKPQGQRIAVGLCKTHSRHGEPLEPIAAQTIPDGFVYMWAPHLDALDSRYAVMGLVPASAIGGKGVALW